MRLFVLSDLTPGAEPRDEPGDEGVLPERDWLPSLPRLPWPDLQPLLVQPARPAVVGEGQGGLSEGRLGLSLAPHCLPLTPPLSPRPPHPHR